MAIEGTLARMSTNVPSVSGISMANFRDALVSIYGADAVRSGLARLDPESRILVEQASAHAWIPATVLADAVDAWALAAETDARELTERGVRLGVRTGFATIWRLLLRVTTDEALIARTPSIYSRTRNVGELKAELRLPRLARLTLTGWSEITDRQLYSLAVSFEEILEITGRTHARAHYRRTADGGIFDVSWGEPRRAGAGPSSFPPER